MVPYKTFPAAAATLIGADTTKLAEATPFVMVSLVIGAFSPGPTLDITTLTLASFTGSTPLHAGSAATQVYRDPLTGNQVMQVREPAGGWHWQASVAPSPAQTVYGYILTNAAGDTLIASETLADPVTIVAVGDGVDIPQIKIALVPNAFV